MGSMVAVEASYRHRSHVERPRANCATTRGRMMKLPRRQFLHLAAGAAALPAVSRIARADTYPSRPAHLIVGFPAGSSADILARLLGQWLSERFGQQVVIENRPGAGTNIATEAIVHAAPDGYSLIFITPANAINATLYDNLKFDFIRDIEAVASISRNPLVMVINPSFSAKTLPEFIAQAKSNPGRLNMASSGNGSPSHVTGELFEMMAGVNMVHVPYRGDPQAITDLLGGQVQVYFGTLPGSIEHIRAGRLRPLAVTTAKRQEVLPDIPTVGEFVTGYEASGCTGIGCPKNTPTEIIDRLNNAINAALADPKFKARLADLGSTTLALSPADFGKLIAEETEKWAKVVKFANIKPD
jgi:tripartite-type tricarboxylate transporter receptor subunit TctC